MKVGDYVRYYDLNVTEIGQIVGEVEDSEDVIVKDREGEYFNHNKKFIKSSENIIDVIEKEDLVEIEYYSERYDERVTRLFRVESVIKKDISFHNSHCQLNIFDGEWARHDKHLKPIIKSIVTHEQIKNMKYRIESKEN